MKKLICLLTAFALLLGLSCSLAASDPIIRDDAGLLTEAEEAALAEIMSPICEYGVPVFWSTTETGYFRSKAEDFYVRMLGSGSGVLFVIDMSSRQLTVLADGAIYRVVTSSEATSITDNVYRLASAGKYADCAMEVFREVYQLLRGEQIVRPMKLVSNLLLAATLALLIVYLYISRRYETRPKTGKVRAALPVTALASAAFLVNITNKKKIMTRRRKVDLGSSDSGGDGGSSGGGSSGGGSSGGGSSGGGGGGFSGGGGSHGF